MVYSNLASLEVALLDYCDEQVSHEVDSCAHFWFALSSYG